MEQTYCRICGDKTDKSTVHVHLNDAIKQQKTNLILTEEELKERNRLLVLENDELLAENMKLKSALNSIVNGQWTSYLDDDELRVWQTDRINPKQIALEALEETK